MLNLPNKRVIVGFGREGANELFVCALMDEIPFTKLNKTIEGSWVNQSWSLLKPVIGLSGATLLDFTHKRLINVTFSWTELLMHVPHLVLVPH